MKPPRKLAARLRLSACLLAVFTFACAACAHNPSKSYLSLVIVPDGVTVQMDIPLADLQSAVPLDLDHDGFVSWDELRAGFAAVTTYALAHLTINVDGRDAVLHLTDNEPAIEDFSDGSYIRLSFAVENVPRPKSLAVNYRLFFDINTLHRGMLRLECDGRTQTAIFTPGHGTQQFEIGVVSPGRQFLVFLREGVWHIWTGYDHILFLLALLLPSVLRREAGQWRGVDGLRPAFVNIFKIVTAFTVAHSLTLSLATLQIVRLPSRVTESAIAASVVLAAANNLKPLIRERGWMVAFAFGLIHGFGFANALSDLGLVHGTLLLTLVGFNLGVEAGQLVIVCLFLPAAFALRNTRFYQRPLLRFGSALIIIVAGTWMMERIFNFKLLPF